MTTRLIKFAIVSLTLLSGCRSLYKISADMDRKDPGSAPILSHSEELSVSEWENKYWPPKTEVITYNFPGAREGVISSDTGGRYIIVKEGGRVYPFGRSYDVLDYGLGNQNQWIIRSIYPSQRGVDNTRRQRGR